MSINVLVLGENINFMEFLSENKIVLSNFISLSKLAWEVSPTVYPRFVINYEFKFRILKLCKDHSRGHTEFSIKNWGKTVQGFVSYDWTNQQRFLYIQILFFWFFLRRLIFWDRILKILLLHARLVPLPDKLVSSMFTKM